MLVSVINKSHFGSSILMESNWINPAENTLPRLGRAKPHLIEVVPTTTHLACGLYLKANDRKLCKELNLQDSEELRTPLQSYRRLAMTKKLLLAAPVLGATLYSAEACKLG
jgi:hypothetical protein